MKKPAKRRALQCSLVTGLDPHHHADAPPKLELRQRHQLIGAAAEAAAPGKTALTFARRIIGTMLVALSYIGQGRILSCLTSVDLKLSFSV